MSEPKLDDPVPQYIAKRRELTDRVKTCLVEGLMLDLAPDEIGLDSPFFGSGLGLDSVDALGIAASLEQAFGIEILDSDINLFRSVNATVDFIMDKQGLSVPPAGEPEPPAPAPPEESAGKDPEGRAYLRARRGVGLVDLSGTEKIRLEGPDADAFLDHLVAGNLADLAVGDILQTVLLDEEGAIRGLVWILRDSAGYLLLGPDESWRGLASWISDHQGSHQVSIVDSTEELGLISVLGPAAQDALVDYLDQDLLRLSYCQFMEKTLLETPIRLCRYGDSGEYDYRLLLPSSLAPAVLSDLEARTDARRFQGDLHELALTLAMEMKSFRPEFLRAETLPTQADLHWMVQFRKEGFLGGVRLREQMPLPIPRAILLTCPGKKLPSGPLKIALGDREVGEVQRTVYSPTLQCSILLAYVDAEVAWPGVPFSLVPGEGQALPARAKSAPLFVTKTVTDNLNM